MEDRQKGMPQFPSPPAISDEALTTARRRNRDAYLRFAGLAMHAELSTAGAFEEPAKALADAAEAHGETIHERIAENALNLADAMIAAMIRRGVQ